VKYNLGGGIADTAQVPEITSLIQNGPHVKEKEREEARLISAGGPAGPRTPSLNLTDPHTMQMNTRSVDDHSAMNLHFLEETSSTEQTSEVAQTTIDNLPVEVVTRILTIGCEEGD
jgi:hypothetical protein